MKPEHRERIIGAVCLTSVFLMALHEGFNGRVATTYALALLTLLAPKSLEEMAPWIG